MDLRCLLQLHQSDTILGTLVPLSPPFFSENLSDGT
eukprot:SAG11_NODE_18650_length_484_cov_20.610390_1_plen_35_part_01